MCAYTECPRALCLIEGPTSPLISGAIPGGRLVANFILIDNFYDTMNLLKKYDFKNIDVSLLNISKLEKLGGRDYFKPHNPIYIISCEKGERDKYE